jgi:uncharacterized protein YkwD
MSRRLSSCGPLCLALAWSASWSLACFAADQSQEGAQETEVAGTRLADPQQVMLDSVNAERRSRRLPPLTLDARLEQVVQAYADELTAARRAPGGDVAQVLMERLQAAGYPPFQLYAGIAQSDGDFAAVLRYWRQSDGATFTNLTMAEVRNFALGVGDVRGRPFYLAVGAVTQAGHFGEVGQALTSDFERSRTEVLDRVNAARGKARRPPLRRQAQLDQVAQAYALDMLQRGFYAHESPEGQDVMDRIVASGYNPMKVGENIASGQSTVRQVVEGWLSSRHHYDNIADPEFVETGIGIAHGPTPGGSYRFLWVQVFGKPMPPPRRR